MGDFTLENVRDFIGLRRLTPSELFNEETITRDPVVRSKIKAEYEMRERLQKDLDKLKEDGAAEVAKLSTANKALRTEIVTGKAKTIATGIITERKMPPERAKYVELHLKDFKVEGDDLAEATIKAQLDKFIDAQVEEATKLETIFKPAAAGAAGQGAGSGAGGQGQGQGQGQGGDQNAGLCIDNV